MQITTQLAIAIAAVTLLHSAHSTAASAADVIVGNDLIERSKNDRTPGSVFVLPKTLNLGFSLSGWSVFDINSNGSSRYSITPLLLQQGSDSSFTVQGLGTTQVSDGSGIQSFDFGLMSGTNEITSSNFFFGWKDGTSGTNNAGVIDYDDGGSIIWLGSSQTDISIGTNLGTEDKRASDRTYSVQAILSDTTDAPIDHPVEPPLPITPEQEPESSSEAPPSEEPNRADTTDPQREAIEDVAEDVSEDATENQATGAPQSPESSDAASSADQESANHESTSETSDEVSDDSSTPELPPPGFPTEPVLPVFPEATIINSHVKLASQTPSQDIPEPSAVVALLGAIAGAGVFLRRK